MATSIEADGLVQVAKWISTLLLTGSGICAAVIALRLLKKSTFKLGQLEVPLNLLPLALVALTIGHAYLTWLLHIKVTALHKLGGSSAKDAWAELVGKSAALVFNGMSPRVPYDTKTALGIVYATSTSDPTFWLNLAFAVSVVVAIVASRAPSDSPLENAIWHMKTLNSLSLGTLLAVVNWFIGSYWAIELSGLAK